MSPREPGLRILMLSLHGLVRGHDLELGRDADTGGQVTYVVELARALGRHRRVESVELLTRLVEDAAVSPDYAQEVETLGRGARIVRIPFGGRRYLRKELLWPHLDSLVARVLKSIRAGLPAPHLIHSHYADAGYVGAKLARALNVPLVHTGHSLGRQKRQRLLDEGRAAQAIERQFNLERRIAAEEETFRAARLVVTSTRQEAEEQWAAYEAYDPGKCVVVPPGVDVGRFAPPVRDRARPGSAWIDRFLTVPDRPLVVALSRPEPKKNLGRLVQAFGEDTALRDMANLAIVAGTRDDIRATEEEVREVLTDLLLSVDRHDLWGKVAIPKTHVPEQVPDLYRLAVLRRGVFVNAALTEPFGLTLLEAAASGLPVVATREGGPRDIVENCRNGLLVDPLDPAAIAEAIRSAVTDPVRWRAWSKNGVSGVAHRYTWDRHVEAYLAECARITAPRAPRTRASQLFDRPVEWLLLSDIDDTLTGDAAGLRRLGEWLEENRSSVAFGVATGRNVPLVRAVMKEWRIPEPDVVAASVGSEILWGGERVPDAQWTREVGGGWAREELVRALDGTPGLSLQPEESQGPYKVSYFIDPWRLEPLPEIRRRLGERGLRVRLIASLGRLLDVVPRRVSKGLAARFIARRLELPPGRVIVAGDSGNDLEMLGGEMLGIVVANHHPEMEVLAGRPRVYFARRPYAAGVLEGLRRWGIVAARHAEAARPPALAEMLVP